jgi:NaMN:DMB phosphoribosyltransferase
MKTISFNILNASATHLPSLHQLSDAGFGQNLMHLTPTRDTELIINGKSLTELPHVTASGNGLLPNGGISPAVLTRGLLQLFYKAGYNIEINSFNFNVIAPQTQPQTWLKQQHFGGVGQDSQAIVTQSLLPSLLDQAERGCISILAECGVGGTTFSTLWLRLLTGLNLSPAGSTTDKQKLASKSALLLRLEQDYLADQMISSNHCHFDLNKLLEHSLFHDQIQQALCSLFNQWPPQLTFPTLCGGMMFVAPLLGYRHAHQFDLPVTIYTTRWVLQGDGQQILDFLPSQDTLRIHSSNFNHSTLDCLKVFEQGQVVEGCGLGGCLVLAEQLGWSEQEILAALALAVTEHVNHFKQESVA